MVKNDAFSFLSFFPFQPSISTKEIVKLPVMCF